MDEARIALLAQRGLVLVSGEEAQGFLQNLITADMETIAAEGALYGALLTPQGKILFDFLLYSAPNGFLLDLLRDMAPALAERLGFYRLRSKVEIKDVSEDYRVFAAWGGDRPREAQGIVRRDPRLAALGWRILLPKAAAQLAGPEMASEEDYRAHRIALGVPEGGADFSYGDAFPHDGDLDQLGGIAFAKGCYVGQEVVSRMEHRSSARRRVVQVEGGGALPPSGTNITAGGSLLGTLGSLNGKFGLALVRTDRVGEALAAVAPIMAGERIVKLKIPDWADFSFGKGEGKL